MKSIRFFSKGLLLAVVAQAGLGGSLVADDWKDKTIAPVSNPVFFEDPHIRSELRPLFAQHYIDEGFITGGGDIKLYAVQLRWAVSERFALIATKDGYIQFSPEVGKDQDGWADIAAGFKYALIDKRDAEFILTPGVTFEIPTGNERVFQGNGHGEWNVFVSAAKGFGNLHLTANAGGRIPNDFDEETAQAHYSFQIDYFTCKYFIPFAVINGFTVLSEGEALPLDSEGYDLINFGSSNAQGDTFATIGGGFRSKLTKRFELGFSYDKAFLNPKGLFDDRYTVDLIFHF